MIGKFMTVSWNISSLTFNTINVNVVNVILGLLLVDQVTISNLVRSISLPSVASWIAVRYFAILVS